MADVATSEVATAAGIHCLPVPTPFAVGRVNTYLIEDDPLTLVDSGPNSATSLTALEAALAAHGHRVEDVERLVITHQHIDHIGLAQILADRSGAEVVALELLAPWLASVPVLLVFAVVPFGGTTPVPAPVPVVTSVEQALPDFNEKMAAYEKTCRALREQGLATLPTQMGKELEINPFLRSRSSAVRMAVERHTGAAASNDAEVFAQLREWKNGFK